MATISLREKFISVTGKGLKPSYGGNQEWFSSTQWKNVKGQGCGLIAAVDCALYMSGVEQLELEEYSAFVEQFLSECRLARFFLHEFRIRKDGKSVIAVGILPKQIAKYLNKRVRILGAHESFQWNGIHGHTDMYEKIKSMLNKNVPVIWALYSQKGQIRMYSKNSPNGPYLDKMIYTNSHYVTITGVIEDETPTAIHPRMLEISSWGKRFYIDYDEYLAYVGTSIINGYCSNIMYLK